MSLMDHPNPTDLTGEFLRQLSVFDFDEDVVLVTEPAALDDPEEPVEPLLWNYPPARVSRLAVQGMNDDLLPRRGRRR